MSNKTQKPYGSEAHLVPWLVLVLVLCAVGSYLAYTQVRAHQRLETWERERLVNQVTVVEENLVRQLEVITKSLEGIRGYMPYWLQHDHNWGRASLRLKAMTDAMPGVRTFLITDAEGTVIAANRSQLIGRNFQYRDYFQVPRSNPNPDTLYISPPFKTSFGVTAINVGRVIEGPDGRFDGVVSATLSPEYFNILLASVLYDAEMWITLVHGDGKPFLELSRRNVGSGSTPYSNDERMSAQRTIQPEKLRMDKPLVVVVGRDKSVLHDEWTKDVRTVALLFGTFVLTLSAGLYLFQLRQRAFLVSTLKYEDELKQNAERFQKIASQLPGAIYQFRLYPDGSSDFLYASDAICNLFRVTLKELLEDASKMFKVIHPEDRELFESSIRKSALELSPWDCHFRVKYADGTVRWLHGRSVPQRGPDGEVLCHGFVTDITSRKMDDDALRGNERFLSTLTDVIPGLISHWNTELFCTFANKEYSTWFGRSQKEMLGIHLRELLGEELLRKDEPFIRSVLDGQSLYFERTLMKVDGEVRSVWVNYMPDIDGNQVRGFYVLVTDVTDLKQAQLKLEETNDILKLRTEEAEQASRSKSRFLATVAHEFRTPLSLLTSSTDILDRYGERLSTEEQVQQREHIRNAARQMSGLVDSVLTFNRLETGCSINAPVEVEVARFCRLLTAEIETGCCSGHDFSVTIADNCGTALLDEPLFRRVLENLLTNAFRYTPAGGTVSFSISREDSRLLVEIADSGIGIPGEDQEHIFEAFYRCRNVETRRGLGLGLSIVREALSQLGGIIAVESTVGAGTAMRVRIPVIVPSHLEENYPCTQS